MMDFMTESKIDWDAIDQEVRDDQYEQEAAAIARDISPSLSVARARECGHSEAEITERLARVPKWTEGTSLTAILRKKARATDNPIAYLRSFGFSDREIKAVLARPTTDFYLSFHQATLLAEQLRIAARFSMNVKLKFTVSIYSDSTQVEVESLDDGLEPGGDGRLIMRML